MKKAVFRGAALLLTMALAISLAGCILTFTIIGVDHNVYTTGLQNPPVEVVVTTSGFIPKWPDVLILRISGDVANSTLTSEQIDDLADAVSGAMYDYLDFDSYSGATSSGDPFWIEKTIEVPDFWSLLPLSEDCASPALGPFDLLLSDVIGDDFYDALVDEMVRVCNEELPINTTVALELEGSLEAGLGSVIGTLDCSFTLHSLLIM